MYYILRSGCSVVKTWEEWPRWHIANTTAAHRCSFWGEVRNFITGESDLCVDTTRGNNLPIIWNSVLNIAFLKETSFFFKEKIKLCVSVYRFVHVHTGVWGSQRCDLIFWGWSYRQSEPLVWALDWTWVLWKSSEQFSKAQRQQSSDISFTTWRFSL